MPDTFTFGTLTTSSYGIVVYRPTEFVSPERECEYISIPGRNGDLIVGDNRLSNYIDSYHCIFVASNGTYGNYSTLDGAVNAFRRTMLGLTGYNTLRDTFDTAHYREASFTGPLSIVYSKDHTQAKCTVEFNCKPQWFLDATSSIAIPSSGTASLPTNEHRGYPLVTVTGTGTLQFWGGLQWQTITITQNFANGLVIDSLLRDCYSVDDNTVSANQYVQFSAYKFPEVWALGIPQTWTTSVVSNGLTGTLLIRWYDL